MSWRPRSLSIGGWRVTALGDGTMRLDGGSMWGVVPKTMWERWTPSDERNTIPLALRPFLLQRGDVVALLEPGIGARWEEKWRSLYALERSPSLEESLGACGVAPADVTHVIGSHCHFDHVGAWVVEREGALAPLFPGARHFAPAIEIAVAQDPDAVRRASYRAEDVAPLERAGLLEGFRAGDGGVELLPGIRAHDASGHSDGVCVITIEGGSESAIFWSDVVPTSHHVQPAYIMAYDLDVARSYASRSAWLARAAERGSIGLFYHDVEHAFGRVRAASGARRRYEFEPLAGA